MKIILLIFGIPIYLVGIILGIFCRPLIEGFSTGYFFVLMRDYKALIEKYDKKGDN